MVEVQRCYWTVKEAAAYIGIHPETLRAYCRGRSNGSKAAPRIHRPKPPYVQFGNRTFRFPIEAFKKWADWNNLPKSERGK